MLWRDELGVIATRPTRFNGNSVKQTAAQITEFSKDKGNAEYHFFNLLIRGVAKVVSRQFRVLETVGSSPAASTKKTVI